MISVPFYVMSGGGGGGSTRKRNMIKGTFGVASDTAKTNRMFLVPSAFKIFCIRSASSTSCGTNE
jgi:hypothetical protein